MPMSAQRYPELLRRFGIELKTQRRQKGFTQESFAEMAGISRDYVSKLEQGKSFPKVEVLLAICEVLKTTPDLLIFGSTMTEDRQHELLKLSSQLSPELQDLLIKIAQVLKEYQSSKNAGG